MAHELIWEVINESGPFDGLISFSQGSALAASILVHHQLETPSQPLPFRFAVFIGATLPFSTSESFGINVSRVWTKNKPMTGELKTWIAPDLLQQQNQEIKGVEEAAQFLSKQDQKDKQSPAQLRQYHPDALPAPPKISIPTAHIYGRRDPYHSQSLQLVRMCDQSLTAVFEHDDGHCIPRSQRISQCIANLIEKTAYRADLGF